MESPAMPMAAAATEAHGASPGGRPTVTGLRAGHRGSSEWTPTARPSLSWTTSTTTRGWLQASAEIELSGARGLEVVEVAGRSSVHVPWPAAPLGPREVVRVRVRVVGTEGSTSEWSEPIDVLAGFLGDGEWTALHIGAPTESATPVLLRTEFEVPGEVRRATLYATAQGVYQASINGSEVDDERLKPGWTSYQWRTTHETTDVTALLHPGRNAIGISAAGGWYTERFGFFDSAREFYGRGIAAGALLVIELTDGTELRVATDESWRASTDGPIRSSGIYQGETYDARREHPGWSVVGFDDSGWGLARATGADAPTPTPRVGPAVRAIEELRPVEILRSPSGATIIDFGQNLVGHVRLRATGALGDVVTLRHAEVLEAGELAVRPLRAAEATDRYILSGAGAEIWEPQFTFHGFRYVAVDAPAGAVDPNELVAVVVHSDMERTGWFETSDPLLSRLHDNIVWSMRGNFLSIPTDCPQRDERLGWTGDIQVFAPTASFLYDCSGLLSSWLEDLRLEQEHNDGLPPHVIPDVLGESVAAAGWGDATTVVPSALHERFGDPSILERQFGSMTQWVDRVLEMAGDRHLVEDGFQFGDWLDPDAPPELPGKAKADRDLVATAYLYRSLVLVASAAELLGRPEAVQYYSAAAARVKTAFEGEYVTPNGRLMSDATSAYALAIMFGLYPDERARTAMGDRLAFLARSAGYRISTGFLGTPVIADALATTGHLDVAERLLLQTENPSWLYPVTMGATTVWERWDSLLEDGSINPGGMTSFNHYALGAIADWLHRSIAGLAPAEPGYRRILIAPQPLDRLEFARAEHDSPYGPIRAGWQRQGTMVIVSASIPPNTTATIRLPGGAEPFDVGSGEHEWVVEAGTAPRRYEPLSLDSSLAQIVDDPEAYRVLVDAVERHDPVGAASFRRHTEWTPGNALREALNRSPQALVAEVIDGFAALEARRGAPA